MSPYTLLGDVKNENNNRIADIKRLEIIIDKLEKRLIMLELKDKLNSGEISEEEYNYVMGTDNRSN